LDSRFVRTQPRTSTSVPGCTCLRICTTLVRIIMNSIRRREVWDAPTGWRHRSSSARTSFKGIRIRSSNGAYVHCMSAACIFDDRGDARRYYIGRRMLRSIEDANKKTALGRIRGPLFTVVRQPLSGWFYQRRSDVISPGDRAGSTSGWCGKPYLLVVLEQERRCRLEPLLGHRLEHSRFRNTWHNPCRSNP